MIGEAGLIASHGFPPWARDLFNEYGKNIKILKIFPKFKYESSIVSLSVYKNDD